MERLEILEGLKAMPYTLQRLLDPVLAAAGSDAASGEASLAGLVGELWAGTNLWHTRFFMVATMTDPRLPATADGATAGEAVTLPGMLKDILDKRLETVELLDHAVDWTRCGNLPGRGRRSLRQLAELALDVESQTLQRLREATRTSA